MFETMTMVFFAFAGSLFLGTAIAIGTFMAVWKTYSAIYDSSGSFFLGFFAAFFVAIMACYFWLVLLFVLLPFNGDLSARRGGPKHRPQTDCLRRRFFCSVHSETFILVEQTGYSMHSE